MSQAPRDTRQAGPLPLIQATCVLVGAQGVLIRGRPGSGKSALVAALLATARPGRLVRLVGDDAVLACACSGRLVVLAPAPTRGLIEVRGLGILDAPHEPRAVVRLAVDLVEPGQVERLPEEGQATQILGVELPRLALPAGDPANAVRLELAAGRLRAGAWNPVAPGPHQSAAMQRKGIIRA